MAKKESLETKSKNQPTAESVKKETLKKPTEPKEPSKKEKKAEKETKPAVTEEKSILTEKPVQKKEETESVLEKQPVETGKKTTKVLYETKKVKPKAPKKLEEPVEPIDESINDELYSEEILDDDDDDLVDAVEEKIKTPATKKESKKKSKKETPFKKGDEQKRTQMRQDLSDRLEDLAGQGQEVSKNIESVVENIIDKGGHVSFSDIGDMIPDADNFSVDDMETLFGILDHLDINVRSDGEESTMMSGPDIPVRKVVSPVDRGRKDPLRMYMLTIGAVPLLSKDGEVSIAKRIEEDEREIIRILLSIFITFKEIISIPEKIQNEQLSIKDIIKEVDDDLEDDELEDEEE